MGVVSSLAQSLRSASKKRGEARGPKVQQTEKSWKSYKDKDTRAGRETRASRRTKETQLRAGYQKAASRDYRRQKAEEAQARRQGRKSRDVGRSYKEPSWRTKEKKNIGKTGVKGHMSKMQESYERKYGKRSEELRGKAKGKVRKIEYGHARNPKTADKPAKKPVRPGFASTLASKMAKKRGGKHSSTGAGGRSEKTKLLGGGTQSSHAPKLTAAERRRKGMGLGRR